MELALLIVGMAIVTYAIRLSMIVILGRWEIPERARRALGFVPIAAFAAIITPEVMTQANSAITGFNMPRLIGGVIAVVVAVATRHILLTFIAGMGAMWIAQAVLGR